MKKLALIALAAFAIACSDDDNDSATTVNASLDGTWKLTAFTLNEPVDLNGDNAATTNMIIESDCYDNSTIVFVSGTTATLNLQELDITLVATELGTDLAVDCIDSVPMVYTYTATDNSVTFDGETVHTFTRSGNTLSVDLPTVAGVPVEGTDGEITYDFVGGTLVFTKQ
jgi:hypothetical protein